MRDDLPIVAGGNDVWTVPAVIVINVVHAFLMRLQAEIGNRAAEGPHLDRVIEAGRRESLWVFRVDRQRHNIMCVPLEDLPSIRIAR